MLFTMELDEGAAICATVALTLRSRWMSVMLSGRRSIKRHGVVEHGARGCGGV
jgi:hypothetical protein